MYIPSPGSMSSIIQVFIRVPSGDVNYRSYKIGTKSALKDLDRQVAIDHTDHLAEAWMI